MSSSEKNFIVEHTNWKVPDFEVTHSQVKSNRYCVVIPVINEGIRIGTLLSRMLESRIHTLADIIIVDGGSTDGSLSKELLEQMKVNTLITKTGPGKLSAQLRCAYAFVLSREYAGAVTIDGNNKDDPKDIPRFIEHLDNGFDFVQGSRFLPGGSAINTPAVRDFAIRYIHAPCLRLTSGFPWTDTTQGFRGYSSRLLCDDRLAIFRDIFSTYELLAYLSYRAPKLGFKCVETGTTRVYPKGDIPTKISGVAGNIAILKILLSAVSGRYNQ